ncbi:MAG: hypothetical protein JWR35_3661 [Marmoricola sp.]|nr:hypothetical protein [Marmoricola sp.]
MYALIKDVCVDQGCVCVLIVKDNNDENNGKTKDATSLALLLHYGCITTSEAKTPRS